MCPFVGGAVQIKADKRTAAPEGECLRGRRGAVFVCWDILLIQQTDHLAGKRAAT